MEVGPQEGTGSMKRTVGIVVLAAILGSAGGPAAANDPPGARSAEGQAVTWSTEHVDLHADAVTLLIGDAVLNPGLGRTIIREWARDSATVDLRVRWQQKGGDHELYLALRPSGDHWAVADSTYLQLGPGVRLPGAPSSPIGFEPPAPIADRTRPESAGGSWQATASVPRYTCGTALGPATAALRFDGLELAVTPPRHDLFDALRALVGRGPRPPGDWLHQEGYEGPPVTIACPPAITTTVDGEPFDASDPHDAGATPGAGFVTEEVAPGVHLVSSDGIRDLRSTPLVACDFLADNARSPGLGMGRSVDPRTRGRVVAGLDGGIWLFWGDRFVRLGDETVGRWTEGQVPDASDDIEVAPDGTVWHAPAWGSGAVRDWTSDDWVRTVLEDLRSHPEVAAMRPECLTDPSWLRAPDGALRAYHDGRWQVALEDPLGAVHQVEIGRDRSVWAANWGRGGPTVPLVARLEGDGWRLATTPDGRMSPAVGLTALGDGSVVFAAGRRPVAVWRLDDELGPWQPLESTRTVRDMVASPAGIIWGLTGRDTIARLDDDGWRGWDLEQATDPAAPRFIGGGGPVAVGQDGSVWLKARETRVRKGCHGIYRFDGTSWSHFLADRCVSSIDVAPDGWVWLRAAPDQGPVDLYAISPDAPAS